MVILPAQQMVHTLAWGMPMGGEWLVIGSGIRASKIAIRGSDLAALPGAETLALAQAR